MKKIIIASMAMLFLLSVANAQDAGDTDSNALLKIEYLGSINTTFDIIRVTNKQSAPKAITITPKKGNDITVTILGLGSYTFTIPSPNNNGNGTRRVEAVIKGDADANKVELFKYSDFQYKGNTNLFFPLAIKFEYLKVKSLDKNTLEVEFKASETEGESQFNVQISTDGITFKTVAVILPSPIVVNQIYKVKIKI